MRAVCGLGRKCAAGSFAHPFLPIRRSGKPEIRQSKRQPKLSYRRPKHLKFRTRTWETDMGGTGVVDRFLDIFASYIDSGLGLLGGGEFGEQSRTNADDDGKHEHLDA